jgi:hypothetical protein
VPSPEAQDFLAKEVASYFPERGAAMTPEMCGFVLDWITTTRARYGDWLYVEDVAARHHRLCQRLVEATAPPMAAPAPPMAALGAGEKGARAARVVPREISPAPQKAGPKPAAVDARFLAGLVRRVNGPVTREQIDAAAARLGVSPAAIQAVMEVESGPLSGFASDGRPTILFEPHIFSRLTARRFDRTNPDVSYPTWDASRYPKTQEGRWAQLKEAYGLDPEAALQATNWGRFVMLGISYRAAGFSSVSEFAESVSRSEENQLKAFEAYLKTNNLTDELQRKDWAGFARGYNGPGQVDLYARKLSDAFQRASGTASAPSGTAPAPSGTAPAP